MIVYENPWFKVIKQDGYHFIDELNSQTGAAVLALRGDSFVMLEMHRLAQDNQKTLEIPRGYADDGETSRQCAARELGEETGYQLNESQFQLLGYIRPNTALLKTRVALYFVDIPEDTQLSHRDNEATNVCLIDASQIGQYLNAGAIEDSFTLAALCYLKHKA
jgi:ADP-ribose pyrophosphatase